MQDFERFSLLGCYAAQIGSYEVSGLLEIWIRENAVNNCHGFFCCQCYFCCCYYHHHCENFDVNLPVVIILTAVLQIIVTYKDAKLLRENKKILCEIFVFITVPVVYISVEGESTNPTGVLYCTAFLETGFYQSRRFHVPDDLNL